MSQRSRKLCISLAAIFAACWLGACASQPSHGTSAPPDAQIRLVFHNMTFDATFSDTDAARAFPALLPMTIVMQDLNANEKYFYLPFDLPTDAQRLGNIEAGDILLYGRNCLVLFYRSFRTSYAYTRIARVDDASNLAVAVGLVDLSIQWQTTLVAAVNDNLVAPAALSTTLKETLHVR